MNLPTDNVCSNTARTKESDSEEWVQVADKQDSGWELFTSPWWQGREES
jgi:hypothetical protein